MKVTRSLLAFAFVLGSWLSGNAQTTAPAKVSFNAPSIDSGEVGTSYSGGELRIVAQGASSKSTPLAVVQFVPTVGANAVDITDRLAALPHGTYDVWVRLKNEKSWGPFIGPVRFTVPTVDPQPPQPAFAAKKPLRPQGLRAVVDPPPPPPVATVNLFGSTNPVGLESADVLPYELGVKFRSSVAGKVRGVRFYKGAANKGPHVGHLWKTDGTLLAETQFSETTDAGWQSSSFAESVPVDANALYVVSYWCPTGRYTVTLGAFTVERISGVLTAPATAESPNGVYRQGASSAFPNKSWMASSYWVDVLFEVATANAPPAVPLPVLLAWDPPTSDANGGPLNDLAGYVILQGLAPGVLPNRTLLGLVNQWEGHYGLGEYWFAVLARDFSGNESKLSQEIKVEVR